MTARLLPTVAAGLLLLGAVAGCSDDDGDDRGSGPQAGTETSTTDDASGGAGDESDQPEEREDPPIDPAVDAELAAVLLPDAPPGFAPVEEPDASGPLDLDAAARLEPDEAAERSVLETRGFEQGRTRTWRDPQGDVIVATVYEFGDAPGATAYLGDGIVTIESFGAQPFDVPAVEGAHGFTSADNSGDQPRVVHGVVFTRDQRFFLVFRSNLDSAASPDEARELAATQARRAEGG